MNSVLNPAFGFVYDLGAEHAERLFLNLLKHRLPLARASDSFLLKVYLKTKSTLLDVSEVRVILEHLQAARSFLVFGVGRDTPMWIAWGPPKTLFLEDDPKWIKDGFRDRVRIVSYGTQRRDYLKLLDREDLLLLELPDEITAERWDAILVDAPTGYYDDQPGRMKSIYTASRLVRPGGVVLVHDMDRPVEKMYAEKFLGPPVQLCHRLGVFVPGDTMGSTP